MKAVLWLIGLVAGALGAAEPAAPVQMEPVRVAAIWANAEVRIVYQRSTEDPRISYLRVEAVREKSAAARAGLEKGMEIVAIQGVALSGLTDEDYHRVMRAPVMDALVLRVRRAGRVKVEELRIAVAK
jgi:C-terminal processing protease CtpA/Prc